MKLRPLYKGIFYTILASLFWGIPQPLFFNEIKFIPAIELVSHRSIWAFIILLSISIYFDNLKEFFLIFKSYRKLIILSLTGILITSNWAGFIIAISLNKVQDASMGYYISPMISIALGYFFLNEKISKLKFISIFMMFFSVVFLLISLKIIPYLAIFIGLTWGIYGLLRKLVNISAEAGLLYESGFISIFALPYLITLNFNSTGYFLNFNNSTTILLILTGVVTIFPLFFFNLGIKKIPLGFAGVIFYLTPTFHFLTSIFILNENLSISKLISFVIIWIAISIFIIDKFLEEKKTNESSTQLPN